jgi:hypothetical protein
MFTLASITAEPSVGELRFIARLNRATIPNGYTAANIVGSSGAIEGSDVFTVSGQTRSKCKLDWLLSIFNRDSKPSKSILRGSLLTIKYTEYVT